MVKWTWEYRYLLDISFGSEVILLDHEVVLFFMFSAASILFSKIALLIYILTNNTQIPSSLLTHQNMLSFVFSIKMILTMQCMSHLVLICISLMSNSIGTFHTTICYFYKLLGEMSAWIFFHFYKT
jgi:hypothetical protein